MVEIPGSRDRNLEEHELLEYLRRPPRTNLQADREVEENLADSSWTVSSLGQQYLALTSSESQTDQFTRPTSLASIVRQKIIDQLISAHDLPAEITTIVNSLDAFLLRDLLRDCRLPYSILRAFLLQHGDLTSELVDIDEAVLHNEKFLRSYQGEEVKHLLITVQQLVGIILPSIMLPHNVSIKDFPEALKFKSSSLPPGGLELFPHHRRRHPSLLTNNASLYKAFSASPSWKIFTGLDWSNVFVAGIRVLRTLLDCEDTAYSGKPQLTELYIYGLCAKDANQKLQHIWDVWSSGVAREGSRPQGVFRSTVMTTFLGGKFQLHIRLKLYKSPLQILLDSNISAGAVGYDGQQILMLPSCARAIEMGSSILTMNVVGKWRQTRAPIPTSVYDYASIGFGLRILPCYLKVLESWDETSGSQSKVSGLNGDVQKRDATCSHRDSDSGSDFGLEVMRRIRRRTKAYNKGPYRLAPSPGYRFEQVRMVFPTHRMRIELAWTGITNWRHSPESLTDFSARTKAFCFNVPGPFQPADDVDSDVQTFYSLPNPPQPFLRNVIDEANNNLFIDHLQPAISAKLRLPLIQNGYRGYLTRRARIRAYDTDLPALRTQLTIPLLIPHDLETAINGTLQREAANGHLPAHFVETQMLIPLYNASAHDPVAQIAPSIPPLRDTGGEGGNLRYFIITKESMWSNQNPLVEGVFSVIWALFWFMIDATSHSSLPPLDFTLTTPRAVQHLARSLQGSLPMEPTIRDNAQISKFEIDPEEAESFRAWVFRKGRDDDDGDGDDDEDEDEDNSEDSSDEGSYSSEDDDDSEHWEDEDDDYEIGSESEA